MRTPWLKSGRLVGESKDKLVLKSLFKTLVYHRQPLGGKLGITKQSKYGQNKEHDCYSNLTLKKKKVNIVSMKRSYHIKVIQCALYLFDPVWQPMEK